MRRWLLGSLVAVATVAFSATVVAEPLWDAATAFQRGDNALAISLAQPLAEQGNVGAETLLGLAYESEGNVAEAAKWSRAAADQGSAVAQYLLGAKCAYGQGVPLDDAQAVVWFRKSAEQAYADAEAELGMNDLVAGS